MPTCESTTLPVNLKWPCTSSWVLAIVLSNPGICAVAAAGTSMRPAAATMATLITLVMRKEKKTGAPENNTGSEIPDPRSEACEEVADEEDRAAGANQRAVDPCAFQRLHRVRLDLDSALG